MSDDVEKHNGDYSIVDKGPPEHGHDPVLAGEIVELTAAGPGKIFADCTTGRGGHSLLLAHRLAPDGTLLCIDADPRNLQFARDRLRDAPCHVRFFHANFSELTDVVAAAGVGALDGFLADLGISTNQLFEHEYGMSFRYPMPLDMRIDPRSDKSAADLVNFLPEADLANVLYELAQERYSRRIARKIGQARLIEPITTTDRLAELVRSVIPTRGGARRELIQPLARFWPCVWQ